jgi:hypothetical protein
VSIGLGINGARTLRKTGIAAATFLVSVCNSGCNPVENNGSDPVALDELGAHLASGICEGIAQCGGQDWIPFQKNCDASIGAFLTYGVQPVVVEGVRRNKIQYFTRQLGDCLDQLANCGDKNHLPVACFQAINGTMRAGGECKSDLECVGNRYCDGDTCPGKCTSWKIPGEECRSQNECDWGLRCMEGFCRHAFPDRDPCESDEECKYFRLCLVDPEGEPGQTVCLAPEDVQVARIGESCGWFETPQSGPLCLPNLSCARQGESGGVCAPASGLGAACNVGTPDPCSDDSYCNPTTKQCEVLPGSGQACVSVSGSEKTKCTALHYCDRSKQVCAPSKALNAACDTPFECLSLSCYGNICREAFSCDPTQVR